MVSSIPGALGTQKDKREECVRQGTRPGQGPDWLRKPWSSKVIVCLRAERVNGTPDRSLAMASTRAQVIGKPGGQGLSCLQG